MRVASIIITILILLFTSYFLLLLTHSGKVKILKENRRVYDFLRKEINAGGIWYFANWKYGISADLSAYTALTQNRTKYRARREYMTGADGGSFAIDWFDPDPKHLLPQNAPVVIFEHGLSGGSNEPYIQKFGLRCIHELHWRAACVIFRGCCGTRATTAQSYHGVFDEDFHIALRHISDLFPEAPIALCGYSLGANLISHYLGERTSRNQSFPHYAHLKAHEPIPKNVVCAGCVCCPFDFLYIYHNHPDKYQLIAGKGMMHWIKNNEQMVRSTGLLDTLPKSFVPTARNIDDHFTRHFFHFPDVKTFYDQISCCHTLDGIRHPILFISTANDTFSMPKAIPLQTLENDCTDNVGFMLVPSGGHNGMFNMFSTKHTFDEDMLIRFFKYHFERPIFNLS